MAILNDKEKNQEVPTSNSIFSIVSTQFSDINKIVKTISGSMLKASDIAKIKVGVKTAKLGVKQVVKGYLEIKAYLESQKINETIELVNTLVSDPVKFIKMMKDPNKPSIQEIQNKENLAIFENFVQIINFISMISEYSNKISFVGLLLLPKRVNAAMKAIMVSLNVIRKKSKRMGLIAEATTKFVERVPDIFKVLLGMNEHLNMFVEASKKVTKKEAKKAIKQFFSMYFYIALELFKIGKFLLTGEYTAEESAWFGLRTKKVEYNFKGNILKQVAVGSLFMAMATGVIAAMKIASDQISGISKNSKRVIKGLKALDLMLFGHPSKDDKKRVKGLITIISVIGINHRKTPYVKAIFYISLINIFVVQATTLSLLMGVIGNNKKDIGRGLVSLDTIFFGGLLCRGLLNIVNDLGDETKFKTIFKANKAILYLALLNIALAEISIISMMLSEIGEQKKNVKKGLKTISIVFFGKEHFLLDGKSVEGLIGTIQSITKTKNLIKNALKFTLYNAILVVSLTIFMKSANILFGIGALNKKIRSGLKTLSYVFFGDLGPNGKYTKAKPKTKLGIIQIIPAVTEQITLGELVGFTLFSIGLSWSFKLLQDVADTLVEFGRHKRKIIKGIQVLNIVLFGKNDGKKSFPGIVDIIKDERLKELTIKEVAIAGAKLFLISLAFFSVGTLVGILGIFAVGAILATVSISFLNIAIQKMLVGLKIVENEKINVIECAVALEKMTLAYRSLAEGMQKIGQAIKPEDLLKATAFIIISPLIMYLMRFCIKPMADPKIVTIATNGSKSLALLSGAYAAFALALVGISASMSKINIALLIPFIATVGLMGLLIAGLGMASGPIIAGCIALGAMSLAMIIFAGALIVLSLAIVVFALSFQVLRMVLPSDEVIDEVTNGVVMLMQGAGRIMRAITANLDFGELLIGVINIALLTAIMGMLIVNAILFLVVGFVSSLITEEMIQSTIRLVQSEALIVENIFDSGNILAILGSIVIVLGYTVIMTLLFVTTLFTLMLSALANTIDYNQLNRNLGLDNNKGLLPILSGIVTYIDDSIKIIPVFRTIAKVMALMGIMVALSTIILTVKSFASLSIQEYDENGHATGKKVLMKKEDFDRAKSNINDMLTTVIGIFFDKDGKPSKTFELISKVKGKFVAQTIGLKMILTCISNIAKVIANMSKLVVPDEEKGFDEKGKPLGWRQLKADDFTTFQTNTEKMFEAITAIFDSDKDSGKRIDRLLDKVSITSTIKMKLIGMIVGTIGSIGSTITKLSCMMVPDVMRDDEGNITNSNYMDDKGNIVKWRQLTEGDITAAGKNIENIMTIVFNLIEKIKDSDLENMKMRTIKKFDKVMSGIAPLTDLINTIIKIGTSQFPMIAVDENGYAKTDEKGNIKTKYISFEDIPFGKVTTSISKILYHYLDSVGNVFHSKKWQHRAKEISKFAKESIAIDGISDIIDNIIKLATGQFPMIITKDGIPELDKNGNPKLKYITLGSDRIQKAAQNIGTIITGYINAISSIIDENGGPEKFKEKISKMNSAFVGSTGIFSAVTPLIDNVTKISSINDASIKKFSSNYKSILSAYNEGLNSIDINSYIIWDNGSYAFKNFVNTTKDLYKELGDQTIPTNTEKTFSATQKLLDKINRTDPTKLGKMADISKNMATFATKINGNFDSLAKAMNENIITALDKVEKSMKDLKDFLEEDFTKNLTNGVSDAVKDIKVTTTRDSNPQPQSGKNKTNNTNVNETPDKKQKEREKALQKELKDMKELANAIRACINSNNQIKVTITT